MSTRVNLRGRMSKIATMFCAACTFGAAIVFAQDAPLPEPATRNGIVYVSGGVGQDEQSALRAMSSKFNLHLLFAAKDGMYLSDVDVVVTSASGASVVSLKSDGPILYLRLAPGRYRISATVDQHALERWVTVPAHGGASVNFYWG